ncbi:Acinus [Operophtera brumata]|uniref:Acinus n=1 Tax=Operophtera brumata TaxID=104452 RepID=A0A0L7KY09_OPEBR|nr:Acinus [Operophtera brumata]
MRRKSERTASKKSKASPEKSEKKVDKPKRTRSRRKKQSTSSENESADDASPVSEAPVVAVAEPEPKPPTTPVKGESPEESQDQVWQVKSAAASDVGEIQKLKICLTRPPSTPERAERSPRSKRKHSRATSSSDTPSVEAPEEKRKSRHRSKRSHRESKDDSEKNDSHGEEHEAAADSKEKIDDEVTQSKEEEKADTSASSENIISTSDEKNQDDEVESKSDEKDDQKDKVESSDDASGKGDQITEKTDKPSDADTTVVSPKAETTAVAAPVETESSANTESQDSQSDANTVLPTHSQSPARRRSMSVDKSEILELHPEESKCESDIETDKSKAEDNKEAPKTSREEKQVSKTEDKSPTKETNLDNDKSNKTGVVEKSKRTRNVSTDSHNDARKSIDKKVESKDKRRRSRSKDSSKDIRKSLDNNLEENHKSLDHSDSIQSNHEEIVQNGQAIIPIVVSRKRRWGSRPAKITTQKSITISTDVLKDIIPDVKPVEFEEVIEEKKHKRDREVVQKIERPVLPKIVIDNSENVERNIEHRRVSDEKDRDRDMKSKEPHIVSNRKISIIKDTDNIITRPPSPPRHKQSSVLYITNLVRPFTLPQLKNLLQRTGRLVENGFWIDKIKSKCYVIYENEDQAIETRHALHGVTWPVSNPKALQVDFSTLEAFDKAKLNEVADNAQVTVIPGTVEDWLREQDMKRERGELVATREWDLGKNDKDKEKDKLEKRRDESRPLEKRRHRTPERSPEPDCNKRGTATSAHGRARTANAGAAALHAPPLAWSVPFIAPHTRASPR